MSGDVTDNRAESRFELEEEGQLAIAAYTLGDGTISFTHTEVPPTLGGRGIGGRLIEQALEDARRRNLRVLPICSFVRAYMDKHPETQALRADR
jgi:predicted GNAT family acetyltransferase